MVVYSLSLGTKTTGLLTIGKKQFFVTLLAKYCKGIRKICKHFVGSTVIYRVPLKRRMHPPRSPSRRTMAPRTPILESKRREWSLGLPREHFLTSSPLHIINIFWNHCRRWGVSGREQNQEAMLPTRSTNRMAPNSDRRQKP